MISPRILIHARALKNYYFGEQEIKLLKTLVRPGKNSIDVGANVGIYTYFLKRLSLHVYCYEPNPDLCSLLEKTFVNQNVSVSPIALSDDVGTAILRVPTYAGREIHGWGSLSKNFRDADAVTTVEVSTQKLDGQGHENIGFIKIDVEGHEVAVINGARHLLVDQRPILMVEIEQRHVKNNIYEIFGMIEDIGYKGSFLLNGTLNNIVRFEMKIHQNIDDADTSKNYVNNFVFYPINSSTKSV